jgi:esterase/lipase superfamily enzyme
MIRKHEMIPSREMGREVHLWRFGHFGAPLLVFPSASGMAHEWDAHGMVEALGDFIDQGRLKLYCTETNVAAAWTRREGDPAWRIRMHQAFETFVAHELTAYIREDCRQPDIGIGVTGTSLGAFYAANFALKHPEIFRYALCMSGRYDISWLTDGYNSDAVYYNNPMAYVPNLEGAELDRVRNNTHLVLVCGRGQWEDGNIEDTEALAEILARKGISHLRDMWGHDVSHSWSWWKRQARHHLAAYLPPAP